MSHSTYVKARIDDDIKIKASQALASMGLSVSDAIRMLMTRIAKEKKIPFDVKVPNKLTRETLEKSLRGEDLEHFDSIEELFKDLDN